MSLTDILGFDPAVRCHPLSLALPGVCFLFHFLLPASSLSHGPPLHFAILSPFPPPFFPSSALYVSSFSSSSSFSTQPPLAVSVSVSRTEEGSAPGNSFAETWHRTAKHEWYIYMAPREKPTRWIYSRKVYRALREGAGGGDVKCIFWKKRANPLSKPCGSSSIVFARLMNSPGFRAWLRNVRCEPERDLFRRNDDFNASRRDSIPTFL